MLVATVVVVALLVGARVTGQVTVVLTVGTMTILAVVHMQATEAQLLRARLGRREGRARLIELLLVMMLVVQV